MLSIAGVFCALLATASVVAQESEHAFGVGIEFGGLIPKTDIKESLVHPAGRAFLRYYPVKEAALEIGAGMGRLEADHDGQFFSTMLYPIDVRLFIQPVREGKVAPFISGGLGLVNFNPVDRLDKPLPRNANKEYGRFTGFFPLSAGFQIQAGDNTMVGIGGVYNIMLTDNLDDIKTSTNDASWGIMLSVFSYISGGNDDLDGDGLLNEEERQLGTDPRNPDTDGEGLRDGEEVKTYKTNPLNKDTDDDGLNDREELFTYRTDPLRKDTDGDGLGDGEEVLTYKTNPLNKDSDADGLTDGDEVLTYRTDPLKPDTDGDTLRDGDEVLTYKTDPLKRDTDGDGLADNDELQKHKTNPLVPDTDKGGVDDGKEVQLGLNPLDPADDVPIIKVGERIILEGVNFETARATLLPSARSILDQVASSLLSYPTAEVAIHGHTDNVGGAKYNMNLSLSRAEAVKAYLVSKGVTAERITTKGFGFTKPVADNTTPDGRARNRRIEFVRVK